MKTKLRIISIILALGASVIAGYFAGCGTRHVDMSQKAVYTDRLVTQDGRSVIGWEERDRLEGLDESEPSSYPSEWHTLEADEESRKGEVLYIDGHDSFGTKSETPILSKLPTPGRLFSERSAAHL